MIDYKIKSVFICCEKNTTISTNYNFEINEYMQFLDEFKYDYFGNTIQNGRNNS